ncbi:hypothetical protein PWT90_06026 [Aphanocladium album]|nr:hypothetical protein PWT90_06026 [Aphanocladium album]
MEGTELPTGSFGSTVRKPLVIDADDIVRQTSLEPLCELTGVDSASLLRSWKVMEKPECMGPRLAALMGSLWQSTSIDETRAATNVDIAVRHEQWRQEFGVKVADALLRTLSCGELVTQWGITSICIAREYEAQDDEIFITSRI